MKKKNSRKKSSSQKILQNNIELTGLAANDDMTLLVSTPTSAGEVERLGGNFRRVDKIHRLRYYDILQAVCFYVDKLEADTEEWTKFCLDPIWENRRSRPKENKREGALQYAVKLLHSEKSVGISKHESMISRALRALRDDGVPTAEIAGALKKRGGPKSVTKKKKDVALAEVNGEGPSTAAGSATQGVLDSPVREQAGASARTKNTSIMSFQISDKIMKSISARDKNNIIVLKLRVLANGDLKAISAKKKNKSIVF